MIASAQPNPSPRSQRDFRRLSPFGVPKLDITVEVCLSAFQSNVMSIRRLDQSNPYALATGAPAVRRLHLLHDLYSPAGRRVLLDAGLQKGMKVADFGCGVGVVTRFGPTRGLNYSLARDLYHMVIGAGFTDVRVDIHQPASTHGENRAFLKLSLEEAGPTFVDAGIITSERLQQTLNEMQEAIEDPGVLILAPRMALVSGKKTMG